MNILALLASVIVTGITVYWVFAQSHHAPIYVVALILSALVSFCLLLPFGSRVAP